MGYYTSYNIRLEADEGFEEEEVLFTKALTDKGAEYNCKDEVENLFQYGVYAKLYDLTGWISDLAPSYPHLLIVLEGCGEEQDDVWEERWKGSDNELQKATIPPFKNQNLKTKVESINN